MRQWITMPGLLLALPAAAAEVDFGWMAGSWCGRQGETRIEEYWTRPAGGALVGIGGSVADGRLQSFEYMRIEDREGKPHFVAQPGGAPPTAFALGESAEQSATFHNPAHDFPQTVRYWREGAGLRAEISGPDGQGGVHTIGFEFTRCATQ